MDDHSGSSGARIEPGSKIGRYTVLAARGKESIALKFSAVEDSSRTSVTLYLLTSYVDDDEYRNNLCEFISRTTVVHHPNVLPLKEVFVDAGYVIVAAESFDGVSLDEWLREPRPQPEVIRVLRAAGEGLRGAHLQQILHGDVTGGNILVGRDRDVRIAHLGFSIARLGPILPVDDSGGKQWGREDAEAEFARRDRIPRYVEMSIPSEFAGGTIGYSAPERVFKASLSPGVDIFSFGVVMYKALFGRMPYRCDDIDTYRTALAAPPMRPPVDSRVPRWLQRVVMKAIQVEWRKTYRSMGELLSAFDMGLARTHDERPSLVEWVRSWFERSRT